MAKKDAITRLRKEMEKSGYQNVCRKAISYVRTDLQSICRRLSSEHGRGIVRDIQSRTKSARSIYLKLRRKNLPADFAAAEKNLNDLAGIRIVCVYLDDLFSIAAAIRTSQKYQVIKEKDFISKPKGNGYRSLHIIVAVPVIDRGKSKEVRLEIQLRTMAMDFWSNVEYQLMYKKRNHQGKEQAKKRLRKYSDEIAGLDFQMMKLREEIKNEEESYQKNCQKVYGKP